MIARSNGATVELRKSAFDLYLPGKDSAAFTVELRGARASEPIGTDLLPSQTNYLIGNDPSRWTHVPNYRRAKYSSLYPGIDLLFYGSGPRIEHDFLVAPEADYRSIRMNFGSGVHPSINKQGGISVPLREGSVEFEKPVIYQLVDGQRKPVAGGFRVLPNGDIGFAVGKYDKRHPLVIDPVLSFATYLSQYGYDASSIAVDSAGNSYVTGYASVNFPVTAGAFSGCGTCGSSNGAVVFISKLSPDGSSLVYSTILGGNSFAQPTGLAVDSKGNAIVSGWTGATDFPTKNGQPILPQNNNYVGFLVSLSADGASLNFGTLLSQAPASTQGSMTYATAVTVDGSDNVYVTGETGNGFPVTTGALNQGGGGNFGNQFNVYVAKFAPAGSLLYSAVIGAADPQNGGGGPIGSEAIAVDSSGNAYVAGQAGILWPITSGAYLKQVAGPNPYATPFVTKVAADAKSLIYSTFLDYAYVVSGISVLSNGDVFVAGNSVGANYPTTSNAYQKGSAAGGEAFLTELNSTGSSLVYATAIGDISFQLGGFALDPANKNIWIVARNGNPQFPLVTPLQNTFPPSPLGLPGPVSTAIQFDPTGQTLQFSTFLGGAAAGYAGSVAVDAQHRAHVSGAAEYGMYTTPGVYDPQVPLPGQGFSSETFAYVAMIDTSVAAPALCVSPNAGLNIAPVMVGTYSDTNVTITSCGNQPLTVTGATAASSVFTVPTAGNKCTQSLAVGQSCTIAVRYTPTAVQTDSSTLTISSNASVTEAVIPLQGRGVVPHISITGSTALAYTLVGQTSAPQVFIIQNTGGAPLVLDASKTGTTGDFAIQGLGNCAGPIYSGCTLSVYFSPQAPGMRTGVLSIASNDPANPVVTVPLVGTGYTAAPLPEITVVTSQLIQAGAPETGFIVTGFGFMPTSVVQLNGVAQTTTYLNSTSLSVDLAASSIPNSYGELSLTVVTPSPGGGTSAPFKLTEFQVLTMTNANLVYEPVSQKLMVSTPASDATNPNTVAIIDPATLTITKRITVGNDPGVLTVSDDGKYLYVALNGDHAIQRINLSTDSIEKTLALPVDPNFGNITAVLDMHVAPGHNTELVATIELPYVSPYEDGIAEFNSTGLVNWIPGQYIQNGQNTLLWLDHFTFTNITSPLYAVQAGSNSALAEISFGPSGVQVSQNTCCDASASGQLNGQHLASDGTLIYTDTGLVWDPNTNKVVKTFAVDQSRPLDTVLPDSSTGKTYFLDPLSLYSQYSGTTIQAFDSTTAALTGSLSFTSNTNISSAQGTQLVRWGTNGFAYRAMLPTGPPSAELFLFTSSISSASNLNPAPVSTSLSPATTPAGGGDFTLTVTGSGFVNGSTVEWNGSPRITTYVSSTKLTAAIYASDIAAAGTAQVLVMSPGPGGESSTALSFTISPAQSAPAVNLSPMSLTFASQTTGTTSAAQTVTLGNSGNAPLTSIAIAISGADAAAFAQTTTCGTTLAAGASCAISVTFSPSAAGNFSASLNVSDNVAGSPQSVTLSGTAPQSPISIGTQTGGSTSSTVTAGQPASYSLSITPAAGYSGTVTLSCSNLPANASCTFNPASLSLSGGKTASFTVTVATETVTAQSRAGAVALVFTIPFILLPMALKRRRADVVIGLVLLAAAMVLNMSACGGGSSGSSGTGSTTSKIAAGTYTFQVVASDGANRQTQSMTLIVQ